MAEMSHCFFFVWWVSMEEIRWKQRYQNLGSTFAQLREFIRRLSSLARNPHVAVARPFSRLSQIASVLALDSLPDLYSLTFFPKALLTRAEISKLIMLRVGLVKSQAAVDAIVWDRVQCVFKS